MCVIPVYGEMVFLSLAGFTSKTLEEISQYDFAVMTLTNDDKIVVRGKDYNAPRDNVLFEMGMCVGSLGRDRTFIVSESSANLKMPSDLAGLTTGEFSRPTRSIVTLRDAVSDACINIKKAIKKLGLKNAPASPQAVDKDCFPKDVKIIEDVGSVLQNQVLPVIEQIVAAGESLTILNFGLDLENVLPWIREKAYGGEFNGVAAAFRFLILNPESPYLQDLIDGDSNISSDSVRFSIASAKRFADNKTLSQFKLEMRQYDLPPVAHGFIINDAHVFLGFTEVKDGKLIGGIKPYIYLNKQQYDASTIVQHYFTFFKTWFEYLLEYFENRCRCSKIKTSKYSGIAVLPGWHSKTACRLYKEHWMKE